MKVILRGAGVVRETLTDAQGKFAFRGVPPVSFSVAVVTAWPGRRGGSHRGRGSRPASVHEPGCSQQADGRISGVMVPLRGRRIELSARSRRTVMTGRDRLRVLGLPWGQYPITGFHSGSYLVGVNLTGPPSLASPVRSSVCSRRDGSRQGDRRGDRRRGTKGDCAFEDGSADTTGVAHGVVVGPDGRPMTEASVSVTWYGDSRSSSLMDHPKLDSRGCFSMRALSGLRYEVHAYATSRCDARGDVFNTLQKITAGKHASPLRLVLALAERPIGRQGTDRCNTLEGRAITAWCLQ